MESRIYLETKEMPTQWYNIVADLKEKPAMPLHPVEKKPIKLDDLKAIFPEELIKQETSTERYIDIPEEVLDIYKISRPTPVIRAYRLEKYLQTPAKIYYKYEGANPAGSHKSNTSIAQAYYNKKAGIKRLVTETGAGQWGSALSLACHHFGLECQVFMVKVSYEQKPYRKVFMKLFGADVIPSPSTLTESGKAVLAESPNSTGSLGIAISEAVEMAVKRDDTNYALGSVLNHVMLHQTIIGEEAKKQLEKVDEYPDIVIACVGGGSNFAGLSFPFIKDKLTGDKKDLEVIAVEPYSCPTLTKGAFAYDYGDVAGLTPLLKMHTLGHKFIPPAIHAGGLRYHGMSPLVSHLYKHGYIKAEAYHQTEVFKAAQIFTQTEGIIPAPESSHAIKSAIEHALKCKAEGKEKTILFNLSGHGFLDLGSYEYYVENQLEDYELPSEKIEEYIKHLPKVEE
ncbi:MAG TPA: TrpB-like pyridoxal phosphate-dependent enzyme [Candidatus Desulfofervidus auxilii]|uniref:Tryptophan synthase beta chain n=1 Tax=Desulfofervidus auxilii TaxID=1621989 RepID=A0A7V0IAC4_DESA2|nr:TrpB-like pyridoxal phosphate-dependent enzyme [Candidatus Desulfofervidus auxilii]